jgi:CBS domain-containing protein
MMATTKNLMALTADDLMSRNVVCLRDNMPLREAARQMMQNQISGAPVVSADGQCVGVLSALDFLRYCEHRPGAAAAVEHETLSCAFQAKQTDWHGQEVTRCTLPLGVCPIQVKESGPRGETQIVCSQPHSVLVDWQVVDLENLPLEGVHEFMTPDPVTAGPHTSIRKLARMMIDAHIHRIIVVDEDGSPIGLVSSTDLLAALAFMDDGEDTDADPA